ncbi:MAG: SCO family protein [Saprospiraceae bacterium]|nr:SCO family protein [Saprospiraceae bacterium]HPK08783.1 SCO family protein [Saprospiraceae bacterium]
MKAITKLLVLFTITISIAACKDTETELPYLGNPTFVNGKESKYQVPAWKFLNQDSITVSSADLSDNVYVVDFFFTSCPSICPKVKREMFKIYDEFKNDNRVKLVSFTIDPKHDTPSRLKKYSQKLGVNNDKWWFLTGDSDETFALADDYFITAYADPEAPGGFDHSGQILLIDKSSHIRSYSLGTDPESTPKFIKDIKNLLHTEWNDTKE